MSLFVLLAEIRYSKSSCPGFLPRSVTVTNEPRSLASLLLTEEVTVQPDGSSPGRKWTSCKLIGVPLTSADHRQAVASTVIRRFFVSILTGAAACAGKHWNNAATAQKLRT